MNPSNSNEALKQNDLLKIILADLRRTVREYTTATTESSCPAVRQMFSDLTVDTLRLQGKLYNMMSQQQIYTAPSKAPQQAVGKALQEAVQADQQIHGLLQQQSANSTYIPAHSSPNAMNMNQTYS